MSSSSSPSSPFSPNNPFASSTNPFTPSVTTTNPFSSVSSPTSPYASLSFRKTDTIRFLNFPPSVTSSLEAIVLASWPPGLESQGSTTNSDKTGATSNCSVVEFKCKGRPFGHFNDQQRVGGLRMVRNVMILLRNQGWEPAAALMCSRRYTAKDTLFFRQVGLARGEAAVVPEVEWAVISPMGMDKLRVVYDAEGVKPYDKVGGDEDAEGSDRDYLGVLITKIKKTLQELGMFSKGDWSHDSFEFEFKSWVWRARGETSDAVRIMFMRLLELMEDEGWRLYTSFVLYTGTDEKRILDSWYFVREKRSTAKAT
ncbi:uncharacterized protein C8A04DRAFT_9933 [Dichotomopilus funicola]|uniref:Uncharacterized protein n=1 Tax=Dichotomopilus funicola TaxID=1934379 RepID=A0AAN6V7R3_9PEZI|nr:hypothetical protein C8A04DRAFT_9933 [Dichotomopilus funicola]